MSMATNISRASLLPAGVKLGQVSEGILELQLLKTSGDVKIILEVNLALSSEVDFSEDRVGQFDRCVITHTSHGMDEISTGDTLIVVLSNFFQLQVGRYGYKLDLQSRIAQTEYASEKLRRE